MEWNTYDLGEVFNSRGDNKDLILNVRKGTICLTNALALCCDALMGEYAIRSLLLIYKTVFIYTNCLYNSETQLGVAKLSKHEIQQLESLQIKYLKRCMQTPRSTSNAVTLLELGIMPIRYEIISPVKLFISHITYLYLRVIRFDYGDNT